MLFLIFAVAIIWGLFMDTNGSIKNSKIFFILHQFVTAWLLALFPFYYAYLEKSFVSFMGVLFLEILSVKIGAIIFHFIKYYINKISSSK